MAKRIRVSDDNGVTWFTLPGSTGEMRRELNSVNDTIFGQDYMSEDVSLGQWQVTANSFYKGVAGYIATVKQGGTPTGMVAEAMALVSGKTYQITAANKRIIDYAAAVVVLDNAVDHTADVVSIDYLNGTVTFDAAYTVTGPVTITANYIPTIVIAKSKTFTLTQTAAEIDTSNYDSAQANGGWRNFDPGLKTVRLEIGGIYDAAAGFEAALASRALMYVDISPANTATTFFRGFFKRANRAQSGDVGALEEATITLNLFVPDGQLVERPFGWYISNASTLNTAVKKVLTAWQGATKIDVQYLPDGTNGYKGDVVVTECSLTNQMEGLNEFRFTFRGDGAPVAHP
jgi:hypothetical protein